MQAYKKCGCLFVAFLRGHLDPRAFSSFLVAAARRKVSPGSNVDGFENGYREFAPFLSYNNCNSKYFQKFLEHYGKVD